MPDARRVTVDVPTLLWENVESRVAAGEFASASDAVTHLLLDDSIGRQEETFDEELMRRLRALPPGATDRDAVRLKREVRDRRHIDLKAMLQVGLDELERGEATEFDLEQFLADAARRFAVGCRQAPAEM